MLLLSISTSFAKTLGGATSGGGDLEGIEVKKIFSQVFMSIMKFDKQLYSVKQLEVIEKIGNEVNIIMSDNDLPTNTKNAIQNGAAYSLRDNDKSIIFIKRDIWNNIETLLTKEVLIHHEIMVLAGIEETGDYKYSSDFEKLRVKYLNHDKTIYCTINLAEKKMLYGMAVPGDLIGSSSSLITFIGAKSDWGILKVIANKAIIWRGVIDSSGLFKMEIGEVRYDSTNKAHLPEKFSVDLATFKVLADPHLYVDPYSTVNPVQNPIRFTDKYVISVSCNKLDPIVFIKIK